MDKQSSPRVRFAPSPTGRFHIGGARTALYNYLLARQTGGDFILRIEDTDQKRFDPNAEKELMESLHWLGIEWDEGPDIGGPFAPYRQSERIELYSELIQDLIDRDHAYTCFCSPKRLASVRQEQQKQKQPPRYDGLCRNLPKAEARARVANGESFVVRFKTPKEGQTIGMDGLRGPITVENATLDDYIILKSDGIPVYHLAAMADDHLMGITHVFRGSEWLPTFPLHVLIYQAFGWPQPEWLHLSVFLNPTGKGKLSKRHAVDPKGGAKSVYVLDLKEMGYLPEAVNNWMALMGWSYDDHTEFFSLPELVEKFSIKKLNPSPASVNYSKLDHFNGSYIRQLEINDLVQRIQPFFTAAGIAADEPKLHAIAPLIQERIHTLDDAVNMAGFFFQEEVNPDPQLLVGKKMDPTQSIDAAQQAYDAIEGSPSMEVEDLETKLRSLAEDLELSVGQLFGILRIAVTGQRVSPPLIETMEILGKQIVLSRIAGAIKLLENL